MGARGPLPKAAFSEPKAPCKGVGQPPTYISDEAKRHYLALSELLSDRLEPEDESILASCAQAMAEIAQGNVTLAREGYVTDGPQGPVMNPWVRVRALAHKEFQTSAAKLGLSPADRHRLAGSLAPKDASTTTSDFDPNDSA